MDNHTFTLCNLLPSEKCIRIRCKRSTKSNGILEIISKPVSVSVLLFKAILMFSLQFWEDLYLTYTSIVHIDSFSIIYAIFAFWNPNNVKISTIISLKILTWTWAPLQLYLLIFLAIKYAIWYQSLNLLYQTALLLSNIQHWLNTSKMWATNKFCNILSWN